MMMAHICIPNYSRGEGRGSWSEACTSTSMRPLLENKLKGKKKLGGVAQMVEYTTTTNHHLKA
jgi:hypothetical protein